MSGSSLADQLKQLGLAPKKAPKPAKKRARQNKPGKASGKEKASSGGEISLAQAYSQRARDEQRQRDISARDKRLKQEQRKALNDALAKLVQPASQNSAAAEIDRFFEYAGKIRKIFVTAQQQQALGNGELGIVTFRGGYHLVAPAVVDAVKAIKAEAVALYPEKIDQDSL